MQGWCRDGKDPPAAQINVLYNHIIANHIINQHIVQPGREGRGCQRTNSLSPKNICTRISTIQLSACLLASTVVATDVGLLLELWHLSRENKTGDTTKRHPD